MPNLQIIGLAVLLLTAEFLAPISARAVGSCELQDREFINHISAKSAEEAFEQARKQSPNVLSEMTFEEFMGQQTNALEKVDAVAATYAEEGAVAACNCAATKFGFSLKVATVDTYLQIAKAIGQKAYYPALERSRLLMKHVAFFVGSYMGIVPSLQKMSGEYLENLHLKGSEKISFGHANVAGQPRLIGDHWAVAGKASVVRNERIAIGRDLVVNGGQRIPVAKVEVGPGLGVSGMSFPQLTAQTHLALMFNSLLQAKKLGVPILHNTGEGGPKFHAALLRGDRKVLLDEVVTFAEHHDIFRKFSWSHATVEAKIDLLLRARAQIMERFGITQEDTKLVNLVAQFGGALNGARGENFTFNMDRIIEMGADPNVKMIQLKLGQAAKRGAAVSGSKVDIITAAMRDIEPGVDVTAPEVSPEWSTPEKLAETIIKVKMATRKPVSIKFPAGDMRSTFTMLQVLVERGALPDHIQLDGATPEFSPGSGNAPMFGDTSHTIKWATVGVDLMLKKLGVRAQVVVDVSGGVQVPVDGLVMHALGADLNSAARAYMKMGVGCAGMAKCGDGECLYGIARKDSFDFMGLSLDPTNKVERAIQASAIWNKRYQTEAAMANPGDSNLWSGFRHRGGIGNSDMRLGILQQDGFIRTLRNIYTPERIAEMMAGVMTREEIDSLMGNG